MGNSCFEKRRVVPKEKRTYKELVIEASCCEPNIFIQAECIVNIDIDPSNSKLNQLIRQVIESEREKESCQDDISEISDRIDEALEFQLGEWKIQRLKKKLFRHTNYIAHLKIEQEITAENMIKIYQELQQIYYTSFTILAQKNIQYVVMPQMWLNENRYSVTMRENSDALFDQLFAWRNQDQKYRATFIVFHTDPQQATHICDSFLSCYNMHNPMLYEESSHHTNRGGDEDVDEDQKMLQ